MANQLDPKFRKSYFDHEISSLKRFKEALLKLTNEISAREKTIELLRNFDRLISQENEVNKKWLSDIIKSFQHLRMLSINIINHFTYMRKISSYGVLCGKYDLDKIYVSTVSGNQYLQGQNLFDKNYLIKMKNDTDFLLNSSLNKYFKFASDSDPFLIALNGSEISTTIDKNGGNTIKDDRYIKVPMDVEMLESIKICQLIIIEELAYYELSNSMREFSIMTGKSQQSTQQRKVPTAMGAKIIAENLNIYGKQNELKAISIKKNKSSTPLPYVNRSKSPVVKPIKKDFSPFGKSKIENGIPAFKKPVPVINNLKENDNINLSNINYNDISYISTKGNTKKDGTRSKIKEKIVIDDSKTVLHEDDKKSIQNSESYYDINKDLQDIKDIINSQVVKNDVHVVEPLNEQDLFSVRDMISENESVHNKIDLNTFTIKHVDKPSPSEKEKTTELLKKMDEALTISMDDSSVHEFNKVSKIDNELKTDLKVKIHKTFDISAIKFDFLSGDLHCFQIRYENYFAKLNQEQKTTFKINQNIFTYIKGNFTKIIQILIGDKLIGLSVLHFDPLSDEKEKLILSNFSTLYYENYFEIFETFLSFLKSSLDFDELYIEIYYGIKGETFVINQYINDIIKKKLCFKWITLENTGTERRTKYRISNLREEERKSRNNLLKVQNFVILSIENKLDDRKNNMPNKLLKRRENEINLFPVTCVLGEMVYNYEYEIKNQQFRVNIEKLKRYSKKFVKTIGSNVSGIKNFVIENLLVEKTEILTDILNESTDSHTYYSSVMSISNRFENLITVKHNGYYYNRIEANVDVIKHSEKDELYYLIRCLDENYSIIIRELEESEQSLEQNTFSQFVENYAKLDQTPIGSKKTILIPSFKITHSEAYKNPVLMEDIDIAHGGQAHKVSELFSFCEINFDFICNKNKEDLLFALPIDSENEIVIKKDFIMAVVNLEILTELNIPIVNVSIIREKEFIKT